MASSRAFRRGVARRWIMSVPSTRMASTCSVTHHGAQLGGDGGTDAAGQHQRGQYRPQLLDHGYRNHAANIAGGGKRLELDQRLQSHDHAGEEAGQNADKQRGKSELIELHHEFTVIEGTPEDANKCPGREGKIVLQFMKEPYQDPVDDDDVHESERRRQCLARFVDENEFKLVAYIIRNIIQIIAVPLGGRLSF